MCNELGMEDIDIDKLIKILIRNKAEKRYLKKLFCYAREQIWLFLRYNLGAIGSLEKMRMSVNLIELDRKAE